MYHTQERWAERLTEPIICKRDNAWLGVGYYFWDEEVDAIHWGHNSKRRTGYFEIYTADIVVDDVLAVFDGVCCCDQHVDTSAV